ncbi:MAG: hypothetical protein JNJ71_09635 [Rubrivivax sp.]|nr:hypothetical protein [Rubrivivax sp.]
MNQGLASDWWERRRIREPYPGLRPFLDHESVLLKGRDSQIDSILERLKRTHFVAVIGGSGSGKSSLIRAGLVPRLRAQGIPEAGDFWIPVVFTPGTIGGQETGSDLVLPPQNSETPVLRLAWKFAQALLGEPDGQKVDLALRDEVAAYIRQGAGFGDLVQSYHHHLAHRGPDSSRARFLFVIDQFEELFHSNNAENHDAQRIVEAVIEHFLEPSDSAYVVMTMRSERLADCAGYLQLPDAINSSSYLVRRLNQIELLAVIEEPARELQLALMTPDSPPVEPVQFSRRVVARILRDVRAISEDPDHLPLLQHLLARVWGAALEREGLPLRDRFPSRIVDEDLERAVDPAGRLEQGWLERREGENTLRLCLENWPEYLLSFRDEFERSQVETLLRLLAFKDPNNGLYFQERIRVDDKDVLPGAGDPAARLEKLLKQGFLDTVNYLYWDKENPDAITLKVSHEAFIRGWSRFRGLIDKDAERFEAFVSLMRSCREWGVARRINSPSAESLLLSEKELIKLDAAGLEASLQDGRQRRRWFKTLRKFRSGDALGEKALESLLLEFLQGSRERAQSLEEAERLRAAEFERIKEEQRQEAERRRLEAVQRESREREQQAKVAQREAELRAEQQHVAAEAALAKERVALLQVEQAQAAALARRNLTMGLGIVGLVAVPSAVLYLFVNQVLWPSLDSMVLFSKARMQTESRTLSEGSQNEGHAERELQELLQAARSVTKGSNQSEAIWTGLPLIKDILLNARASSSEPSVLSETRRLLVSAVWSQGGAKQGAAGRSTPARADPDSCEQADRGPQPGRIVKTQEPRRGFFIPQADPGAESDLVIFEASLTPVPGGASSTPSCRILRFVQTFPKHIQPFLLFEETGQLMALVNTEPSPGITLFNASWGWDPGTRQVGSRFEQRRFIKDPRLNDVLAEIGKPWLKNEAFTPAKILPASGMPGGLDVAVGTPAKPHHWRVLFSEAQPLRSAALDQAATWAPLRKRSQATDCAPLEAAVNGQLEAEEKLAPAGRGNEAVKANMFDVAGSDLCVAVVQYTGTSHPGIADHPDARTELLQARIYSRDLIAATKAMHPEAELRPLVSWTFATQKPGTQREWWIGTKGGAFDGWLASRVVGAADAVPVASPFSLLALQKLSQEILANSPQLTAKAESSPKLASTSSAASSTAPAASQSRGR